MRVGNYRVGRGAWACLATVLTVVALDGQAIDVTGYRVDRPAGISELRARFSPQQLELLEKINRADVEHLGQLREIVVPRTWSSHELDYATMPKRYSPGEGDSKLLIVHLPGQMFGAYEAGRLVRWGPVSSGARETPTPEGLFRLNWRSLGHASTINPEWFMRWYFNFDNHRGLALHQRSLPGYPASHGCVRLLERDASWLFDWGEGWTLDAGEAHVIRAGTPVLIVGPYDVDAPPPWRSLAWLAQAVVLPPMPWP
jgi:lipoprotein-anchoring transpeptidase ErfK/SrfK